jgi:hypothetical protein
LVVALSVQLSLAHVCVLCSVFCLCKALRKLLRKFKE